MSSLNDEDPSLPVDFDGSMNPDDLEDVTLGPVPMVQKAGSGRMSPVRGRTMKEYDQTRMSDPSFLDEPLHDHRLDIRRNSVDDASLGFFLKPRLHIRSVSHVVKQIADLKKENFSLKLRIYFLEERMQQKLEGDGEDLFKTNIELKVEIESLKRELTDKQDLLKKASTALESISSQHQVELQQARDEAAEETARELRASENKVQELEEQLDLQQQDYEACVSELEQAHKKVEELVAANLHNDLEEQAKVISTANEKRVNRGAGPDSDDEESSEFREESMAAALEEKDQIIEQLRSMLKTKELIMEQDEEEQKDYAREAQRAYEKQLTELQLQLHQAQQQSVHSHEAAVEDYQQQLTKLTTEISELHDALKNKDNMIGRLEDVLRERDKDNKDVDSRVAHYEREASEHKQNALKLDKAIQGLSNALLMKNKEVEDLVEQLEGCEGELKQAKDSLHSLKMDKYKGMESSQTELNKRDNLLADLEAAYKEKEMTNERLHKTIGRRESEIARLNQQLEKAEDVLHQREDALQSLREALQDERQRATEKAEMAATHYQAMLDDAQRQMSNQEKLVQRLTKSLQDKDRQLQDYMQMVQQQQPMTENRETIINGLQEQIEEKDKDIEEAMNEKYKALEERDIEIRQLKMALRERDRDIERANQMLLTTEETIDALENEGKEKEQTVKQLTTTLKATQQALEEAAETHAHNMEEKEAIIEKLRASLASKDRNLQETIRASPNASDTLIQQLQHRLEDKDKLLQEMMADHKNTAENRDQSMKDLHKKLRTRDNQLKELQEETNATIAELNRQVQNLQSELNKKDYELQMFESRSTWTEEQQQEMLDKMRESLNDKDRTIEVLVESAREKDNLLRQMQDSSPVLSNSPSPTKLAELQAAKDEIANLKNELNKKQDKIERLLVVVDRRSPNPTMVSRQQMQNLEDELQERNGALQRSLVAEKQAKIQLIELQRGLNEAGISDITELDRLRREVIELRKQVQRPGTPQRSQTSVGGEDNVQLQQVLQEQVTETEGLQEVLKAEHELYRSLNQSLSSPDTNDYNDALDAELAALQGLRHQLEEGIVHNNKLRGALEKQIIASEKRMKREKANGGSPDAVSSLKDKVQTLETELEESRRWNALLQTRLEQQQPINQRGGGVGGSREPLPNGDIIIATTATPDNMANTSHFNDTSMGFGYLSLIPSFRDLPDVDTIVPSKDVLSKMSKEELQGVIHKLKDELKKACALNETLSQRSEGVRGDIPGANVKDTPNNVTVLERQLEDLKHELTEARKRLSNQSSNDFKSPKHEAEQRISSALRRQINDLNQQLAMKQNKIDELASLAHDRDNMVSRQSVMEIHNELAKLRTQLAHSENLNALLKRQLELNVDESGKFNPELIVQMAQEIESLKEELEQARIKLGIDFNKSGSATWSTSPSTKHFPTLPWTPPPPPEKKPGEKKVPPPTAPKPSPKSGYGYQIQQALQEQVEGLQAQLNESKTHGRMLQSKLGSTEETVRSQTDKMKYYRGLLEDHGLISPSPVRSRSESNLSSMDSTNGQESRSRASSTDGITIRSRAPSPSQDISPTSSLTSLDLSQFADFGQTDSIAELKNQVNLLRSSLQKSNRIIRGLNYKLKQSGKGDGDRVRRRSADGLPPSGLNSGKHSSGETAPPEDVSELKNKLAESEQHTKQLQELFLQNGPSKRKENELKNKISEGQDTCSNLRRSLGDLRGVLGDILKPEDMRGEVKVMHLSSDHIDTLQSTLSNTQDLANHLSDNLAVAGEEAVKVCIASATEESSDEDLTPRDGPNAHRSLMDAYRKNHELQKEKAELYRQVSSLQEKLLRVEAENGLLQQRCGTLERLSPQHVIQGGRMSTSSPSLENAERSEGVKPGLERAQEMRKAAERMNQEKSDLRQQCETLQQERGTLHDQLQQEQQRLTQLQNKTTADAQKIANLQHHAAELGEKVKLGEQVREKLAKRVRDHEQLNGNLKKVLQDQERATEKLRAEVLRLNERVNSEQAANDKLSKKLRNLRKQLGKASPHSSEEDFMIQEHMQSQHAASIERTRNASDTESLHPPGSPIFPEESSHVSSGISRHYSHSQNDEVDSSKHLSRSDYSNLHSDPSLTKSRSHPSSDRSRTFATDYPDSFSRTQNHLNNETSDINHSELYQQENAKLLLKLESMQHLNENLRSELKLYENMGAPNGTSPSQGYSLQRHLEELRELRQKLEATIEDNNRLREALEKQMTTDDNNLPKEIRLEIDMLKGQLAAKDKQLKQVDQLARELHKMKSDARDKESRLREATSRLAEKDSTNQRLTKEKEALVSELRQTHRDLKRFKDEINRLREQADENQQLNKTLNLELSFYDRMHKDTNGQVRQVDGNQRISNLNGDGLDLNLLMDEIRQLRVQLVKTIDNNNALRNKLEELMRNPPSRGRSPAFDGNFNHNINAQISAMINGHHSVSPPTKLTNGHSSQHSHSHGVEGENGSMYGTRDSVRRQLFDSNRKAADANSPPAVRSQDAFYPSLSANNAGDELGPGAAPSSRAFSDNSMRYNITDPSRPPGSNESQNEASKAAKYRVTVKTGDKWGAGTDANVYIILFGEAGESPEQKLDDSKNNFERKRKDEFTFECPSVGTLKSIRIRHDNKGGAAGWYLEYVEVADLNKGHLYVFSCERWLAVDEDDSAISRDLVPSIEPAPAVLSPNRISGDIRRLYAVGTLDDYELIKKEVAESVILLASMEAKLKERLRCYSQLSQNQSAEHQALKNIASSADNLHYCLKEQQRIISLFWFQQLPQRDANGHFIEVKTQVSAEHDNLQHAYVELRNKYTQAKHLLKTAQKRLEVHNKKKEGMEDIIIRELNKTHKVLRHATCNLQKQHGDGP